MAFSSFEDLAVWKRASRLAVELYRLFQNCKDFGIKDQITRAAVSIASNIAEGAERGTKPEFIRYLRIAKGSAAELRTQLYISSEIGLISNSGKNRELFAELKEISSMLQGLINSLQNQ